MNAERASDLLETFGIPTRSSRKPAGRPRTRDTRRRHAVGEAIARELSTVAEMTPQKRRKRPIGKFRPNGLVWRTQTAIVVGARVWNHLLPTSEAGDAAGDGGAAAREQARDTYLLLGAAIGVLALVATHRESSLGGKVAASWRG